MRGYKLIVHDHHGRWKSRSAYYRELLIRFLEEFTYPPSTDTAVLKDAVAKRPLYMDICPLPSKSYPLLEQSVLLSCDLQLHCFNTGCTQKPLASVNRHQTGRVAFSAPFTGYLTALFSQQCYAWFGSLLCKKLPLYHSQRQL